jgi:hypothetical protein
MIPDVRRLKFFFTTRFFQLRKNLIKMGNEIARRISMPGMEIYGAYQGFFCILAFLTSFMNQLPSSTAAISTGTYFIISKNDATET